MGVVEQRLSISQLTGSVDLSFKDDVTVILLLGVSFKRMAVAKFIVNGWEIKLTQA
jgi:hypothetical protein